MGPNVSATASALDDPPALECAAECELVGVFEVAADGQAAGQAGDLDAQGGQAAFEVPGGGVALDVRVGGQDDLLDRVALDAAEEVVPVFVVDRTLARYQEASPRRP